MVDRTRDRTMLLLLGISVFIAVANTSASAVAQPAIGSRFAAGPADVGWVVFGYTVAFAVGTAIYGRLAERFGLGRTYGAGVAVLAVGSAVAAAAPALEMVIAARMLQGVGAGAIPTLSAAIVAVRFTSPRQRATAFGVLTGAVGVAQALGPILGGVLVDLVSWRAAVAIGAFVAPIAVVMYRDDPRPGDRAARPDVRGAWLVTALVASFVFVANRLPVAGLTGVTMVAVVVMLLSAAASRRHSRVRRDAFLPREVTRDGVFRLLSVAGALGSASYLGTVVGLPSALARVHDVGAVQLGLVLAPMASGVALASFATGRIQSRIGRATTTSLSLGTLVVGGLALAVVGVAAPVWLIAVAAVPLGVGFGLLQPPLVDAVSQRFDVRLRTIAMGVYYLLFFVGGALGGAITTSFVQEGVGLRLGPIAPGLATAELVLAAFPATALVLTAIAGRRGRQTAALSPVTGGADHGDEAVL